MIKIDCIFSGLGITKRDNIYVSRSLESFGSLLDNIYGVPVVLEHPEDQLTLEKTLLTSNTNYMILGFIEKVHSISEECIRVNVIINDPLFIDFYNSLSDDEKANIHISPAVTSDMVDPVKIGNNIVYQEVVTQIDHLAIVSQGYWMRYIDDQPVRDIEETVIEEVSESASIDDQVISADDDDTKEVNNIDFVGEVESTSQTNNSDNNCNISLIQEKIDGEAVMACEKEYKEFEEKEIDSEEVEKEFEEKKEYTDSEEVEKEFEEKKEYTDSEEEFKEEKVEEKKCDSDETIEEKVEELEKHEKEEAKDFKELAKQHEEVDSEEFEEKVEEEEYYDEEDDMEKEVLVKLVSNLVDSVEGFRKPKFNSKEKSFVYAKKALKLNEKFVDSKFVPLIDSINSKTFEFSKFLLDSIKSHKKENKKSLTDMKKVSGYDPVKLSEYHTRRKFF